MRSEAGTLLSSQGQRLAPPTRRKPGVFTSHSGFAVSQGDRQLLFRRENAIILSTIPKKTGILPEESNIHQRGKNVHSGSK